MINLNPTENNLVKFNLSISGTKAVPSSVRFLIGDNLSKISFTATQSEENKNEWCATVYPLSDVISHFSNIIYATVEVVLNGRTIIPYNKPVNINKEIEQIEVKLEPSIETHKIEQTPKFDEPNVSKSKQLDQYETSIDSIIMPTEETKIKESIDIEFISKYEKDNVSYSLWYKGTNWHELTHSAKENDKALKFVKDWHNKSAEEIHNELTKDGYTQINENVKTIQNKLLLKDIAIMKETIKKDIKEEKIKPKKTYKLKPFNTGLKNIKHDNKSLKDIMVIEDIDLSKISVSSPTIIQKAGNHVPFKLIKKNVVYK